MLKLPIVPSGAFFPGLRGLQAYSRSRPIASRRGQSSEPIEPGGHFMGRCAGISRYRHRGLQTFQLRLYNDGTIEIAYANVNTTDAVTGITPGGLQR